MKDKNEKYIDDFDDRVERFLRNEMSTSESEEFKTELKRDSQLAENAKSLTLLIQSVKKVGRIRDRRIIESVLQPKSKHAHIYSLYSAIFAIAASLLLLVGITDFFIARRCTINLGISYMTYAPQFDTENGEFKGEIDNVVASELQSLFVSVQNETVSKHLINRLAELFEIAISDKVNQYTDFGDSIGYNLAIAYLKDNDRRNARRVLVRLLEIYPNYENARRLLKEIDNVKGLW